MMAWHRRMSGIAGPFSASGEASNGEPVQIEMYISGAWTDITAYVMVRDNSGNISITRGIRDEGGQADHAVLRLLLDNRDGRFSPRNPTGVYFGLIGRNQPIRISVPNGIGGKSYRFWGEVSAWPQMWDPTGTDIWVELEASGILRRLSQGPPLENSPIYDAITVPGISGLRAYWPCEDASGATEVKSALVTGSSMVFLGQSPDLAASALFGGSFPLPTYTSAAMLGGVPKYDTPNATQVRFLLYIPPQGARADLDLMIRVEQVVDIGVSTHDAYELYYNAPGGANDGVTPAGSLSLEFRSDEGLTLGSDLHHAVDVRGKLLRVSLEFEESGSSTIFTLRTLDLTTGADIAVSQTRTTTALTRVINVKSFVERYTVFGHVDTATGLPNGVMGHITLQDQITPMDDLGVRLDPSGETAGRRVERLCGEEGIAFDGVGDLDSSVTMGGQGQVNRLSLMQECDLADDGMLTENLAVLGLAYRTRQSLETQDPQLTLSYTGFNLSEVPLPVEDDRYIQNKVTVTVKDVSATYALDDGSILSISQPPTGVGAYGTDLALNLFDTDDASDHAAWRVHLGTVDEARFPQISVNLAHSSFTNSPALKQAVLALRQGDRILVENPPSWLPPDDIDQIILGFEETITHFEHRITFICAPASPYRVGFLNSDAARIDTDGSKLVADVTSSATALTIAPTSDPTMLWTTSSAEFPFDVRMSGEVMRATNITSWLDDTFTRTESSTWGTPDIGTAWSNVGGGSASDYSVNGSAGLHTLSTVNVSRRSGMSAASADFDIYCDITTSDLALGSSLYGGVTARMADASNMMIMRAEFTTSNTIIVSIRRILGGTHTALATATLPITHVAGTFIRTRFQGIGAAFRAKAWDSSTEGEPPFWLLTGTDSAISVASQVGTRSISDAGNTNAATVSVQYDNYEVVNPQTFTVTRSINSVTKAQTAGADIRLAFPTPLAL